MTDRFITGYVLFDLDGVVADSTQLCIDTYEVLRTSEFADLPAIANRTDLARVYRNRLSSALSRWLPADRAREFWDRHSLMMSRDYDSVRPFPGIEHALQTARRERRAIVSSAYASCIDHVLSQLSLTQEDFAFVIGREMGQGKLARLRTAVELMGGPASCGIYVGDLQSDVLYAHDVGLAPLAVGYGYQTQSDLCRAKPQWYVDTPDELRGLLERLFTTSS